MNAPVTAAVCINERFVLSNINKGEKFYIVIPEGAKAPF
jgi:hypothetical protein